MSARLRARRGSALILVLLMTLAVAALAVAAIFMSSSAGLLSRFYDRERQYAYAAQAGLERVLSRLRTDTAFTVEGTAETVALDLTTIADADSTTIAGARVKVWAARTGDTTATGPITVSLLAQVIDASGSTRFVRRLDLRQFHFAQWSFVTNTATSATSLPFHGNSFVAGRVHANGNWQSITQATYRDSVTSTGTFGVTNANNLKTGRGESQRVMRWPDASALLASLDTAAQADSLAFDISGANPARAELVWRDLDADGVADRNEGFVRVFELENSWDDELLEVRPLTWTGGNGASAYVWWDDDVVQNQCGAFYRRNGTWQFFPVATHRAAWAWAIIDSALGVPAGPTSGNSDNATAVRNILSRPTARCFPAGSPYLVNTERFTDNGGNVGTGSSYQYPFGEVNVAHRYGGQDSTLTMVVQHCDLRTDGTRCNGGTVALVGEWRALSATPGWTSLAPLDDAGRGAVVYFDSDLRLSGQVAGRVTVAVDGTVQIVDHLTHASGPNAEAGTCANLLGVIAADYLRVEESMIAHRVRVGSSTAQSTNVLLGGRDHFALHGALFSLGSYVGLDGNDFRQGNSNTTPCDGSNVNAGCIRHTGAAAMDTTRTFSSGNAANGGRYVLTPDACFERGYRPPYYPATNRYQILRAVDVRPSAIIGVNGIAAYFARLQGTSDIP